MTIRLCGYVATWLSGPTPQHTDCYSSTSTPLRRTFYPSISSESFLIFQKIGNRYVPFRTFATGRLVQDHINNTSVSQAWRWKSSRSRCWNILSSTCLQRRYNICWRQYHRLICPCRLPFCSLIPQNLIRCARGKKKIPGMMNVIPGIQHFDKLNN